MSIADELREYATNDKLHYLSDYLAIADRIDAEHEAMLADVRKTVYQGLIELPKDADGEYIRIGDVMEWVDIDGEVKVTCTVEAVGVDCFFVWDNASGRFAQKCASAYRHHYAPTVEDVLTEFAAKLIERSGLTNGAAQTIAEYAAKLRLAEEDA